MIVISGPASKKLGEAISRYLNVNHHETISRIFPDGESYIRVKANVQNQTVIVVQTTAPDNDRKMMQLLILVKTIKDRGAKQIIACVPYLAYMRQDKQFLIGEALSFDIILSLLEFVGVDDLIVVDVHNEDALNKLQLKHSMRVHTLSAIPVIAQYLKSINFDKAFSVSPDAGRKNIVQQASKIMGGGFGFFDKNRDLFTGETSIDEKKMEVTGRKVVVFDDIISSGGTMANAIRSLKKQGASNVAAVCTHALFRGGAEERLLDSGADLIIATDTVASSYSKVSIAKMISDYLKLIKI